MEDDLIFLENEDGLNLYQMEDDLNILENRRRPKYFFQWQTPSIFWKMEDAPLK